MTAPVEASQTSTSIRYSSNESIQRYLEKYFRARAYALAVREVRNWPPATQCLCPWLWEFQRKYWHD